MSRKFKRKKLDPKILLNLDMAAWLINERKEFAEQYFAW